MYVDNARRYRNVLAATIVAAKLVAKHESLYRREVVGLLDKGVYVTVDSIASQLPAGIHYTILELLSAIRFLHRQDLINDVDGQYDNIRLTPALFYFVAEEWAYDRGFLPYVSDDDEFVATLSRHRALPRRALKVERKEVSHA